tara:strand:+ start:2274 stop:3437 length:1164 start_codon:yes stop_codon:yes gene_type:complete
MLSANSKYIITITGLNHLIVHAGMLILPAIFLTLITEFNTDIITLGKITMFSSFVFGLGAIPTGFLEKHTGSRTLLLICQTGIFISGLLAFNSKSLDQLMLSLILLGLFCSMYHPAGLTMISKRIKQTGRAMGYHGMAGNLGLAFGPLLASWFILSYNWRFAYLTISVISLLLLFATLVLIPARQHIQDIDEEFTVKKTDMPSLMIYYLILILVGFTFSGFTTFLPTHFSNFSDGLLMNVKSIAKGGFLTSLVLLGGMIGQWVAGRMGDKFDKKILLSVIFIFNIPLILMVGYTENYLLLFFAFLFGITYFAYQPIGNTLLSELTHSSQRGIGYGISFFLTFGVGSAAALIGGYLTEKEGTQLVFIYLAVIMFIALLFTVLMKRISK